MKIAISTDSGNVSGHFGRCSEFTLAKIEDGEVKDKKEIENPGHETEYIPRFLNEKEIDCLITGGIERKAVSMFDEFGVRVITGLEGTDTDKVISQFVEGEIESRENPFSPGEGKGTARSAKTNMGKPPLRHEGRSYQPEKTSLEINFPKKSSREEVIYRG